MERKPCEATDVTNKELDLLSLNFEYYAHLCYVHLGPMVLRSYLY